MPKIQTRRKYGVHASTSTLINRRYSLIHAWVDIGIKRFLTGKEDTRNCVVCGGSFEPVHRYHFNCSRTCLREWNRGQIRPRKETT